MGDHPVVWSNEHVKARNVYIFMGHRAEHFQNQAFTTLFRQFHLMGSQSMIRSLLTLLLGAAAVLLPSVSLAQQASFRVLAFYTAKGEPDHIAFAEQALPFFAELAKRNNFHFESTTRWENLNAEKLKDFQLVLWINDFPTKAEQRTAFQDYMKHGGAWLGFHVSAYNDESTRWPWFVDFLGGGVFYATIGLHFPRRLIVDDRSHPVTHHLPDTFTSPANEWYIWKPSPRLNKHVKVLLTLDSKELSIGLKDTPSAVIFP